jgi:drug/metabolite transporter (DMT)-like permease
MLSLVLAVLAALGNATASVLQRKANRDEPEGQATGLALLWHLLHRPAWVGGVVALVVAFLLQAAALATGPIVVVQPILVLELAFTLMLASMVFHSRLHAREWTAIAGMSVGLAGMLYALQPAGGDPHRASIVGWVAALRSASPWPAYSSCSVTAPRAPAAPPTSG